GTGGRASRPAFTPRVRVGGGAQVSVERDILGRSWAGGAVPLGPIWAALPPPASSRALCRSKRFSPPPIQIASLRDAAPAGPPLTGASSMCAPFRAKAALSFFTTLGELVDRSK